MATMSALIYHAPGKIAVEQAPKPEVGPGDLLIRTRATSICASDIRVYKGEKKARAGVIPGHEIAGEVAAVGAEVTNFKGGERVIICPIVACGECYYCMTGKRNRCSKRVTLGYDENGGLAEFVLIPSKLLQLGHVIRIADDLQFSVAAMTEPFACTLNSLETCKVQPGGSLAIIGAGPMGLTHLLLARAMGVATIVISDVVPGRLKVAEKFGATVCVNPTVQSMKDVVLEATRGAGADAVILSVGNASAVADGLELVRKQGYYNLFAGFPPGNEYTLDANKIHYDEIFMTGTQNATPDHYIRASQMLRRMPQAEELLTNRYTASDANKAYESRLGLDGLKSVVEFK